MAGVIIGGIILTVQDLENAIAQYNQILQEQGADSAAATELYAAQQQRLSEYGNGNADVEPSALKSFVQYLKIFGGSLDEFSGDMKWTPAGELAMARFEYDLREYEQAARVAEEEKRQQAPQDGDIYIPPMQNNLAADVPEQQSAQDAVPEPEPINIEEIQEVRSQIEKIRLHSPYSDRNQFMLDRVAADVYLDMGVISAEDHAKSGERETIEVLGAIPDLQGEQATEFSERFIDKIAGNEQLFDMAPPATLANAYIGTKERIVDNNGDKSVLGSRLEKLARRIDDLTAGFATNSGYYFADTTNIADVYDGYNKMFDARSTDLDKEKDAEKVQQIEQNKEKLETFIKEYDERWGLSDVAPQDAPKLSKRWDDLVKRAGAVEISDETMRLASKYKFLDADGNLIPQFRDAKGKETAEYKKGYSLDDNGRLNRVIDLARHDIAMRNVAKVNDEINDDKLEADINDRIPLKLFEIDTADKVMQGAMENPEQFTDPKFLEKFVDDLSDGHGEISNNGYEAAMDAQVNQTGGFASRLKSKLKDGAKKVGGFFGKLFKPIQDIDKRKDARVSGGGDRADKRKKRMEFFVRILKGFGSAFLVSAAITTIATAAAATAGISLAVSLAAIGVVTGIVMGAVQVHKWRQRQQDAGQPADINAFLKDRRMLATMGTTALASVAMIFGAAGLSQAALALGYGALALGGSNNAIAMYKDAKNSGMSTAESLTWSFANAAAIIGGGIGGRMAANAGIAAYNQNNPENTIFQTKEVTQGTQQVERQETHTAYTDDALRSAERIAKMWYADNPTELHNRVDMINAYNAEHGTTIDPYRAIVLNANAGGQTFENMAQHVDGGGVKYSGGNHTVLTKHWGAEYGFDRTDLSALKNLFMADGTINPDGMRVAMDVDPLVSAHNEVGGISGGDAPHYDGVLPQNTVDAQGRPVYNTYADGASVFESHTVTVIDNVPVDVTTYTPVDVPWGMGMFGISYPRTAADFEKLNDRVGALLDRIDESKIEKRQEPVKPIIKDEEIIDDKKIEDDEKLLPENEGQDIPIRPKKRVLGDDALDPTNLSDEEKKRRQEYADKERADKQWGKQFARDFAEEKKRNVIKKEPEIIPVTVIKEPEVEQEPRQILNVTRAQANNLDVWEKQIGEIETACQKPGLKKAQADKLWAKQKDLQQKLQTLKNQLGRPSADELDLAKSDAYRRYDLQNAIDALSDIRRQIAGYEAHKDNRSKYDGEALRRKEAEIIEQIKELGGAESLEDLSYLYEPVPFKPDYSKPAVEVETPASVEKKDTIIDKFRKGAKVVRDFAKDNFGIGQEFDDEMERQKDVRDKLKREYDADKKEQEKLRRKQAQRIAHMQYNQNKGRK
jgi:hypothetical protein